MGHMLKNTVFRSGSYALGVPVGTSAIGPDSPVNGQTRYNNTTGKLEFYANITGTPSWNAVAREGNVTITRDNFTGNAVAIQFWPVNYSSGDENKVIVHAGTVYQIPTTNYTFGTGGNAGNIIFSSAPSNGAVITIIGGFASTVSTLA
jgi:hypothetical protein